MAQLSAVILTQNEETHLPQCIASLQGVADEIVVVDSGSTDRTVALAASLTPHVYGVPGRESLSLLRQAALALATSPWVLFVDADERLVFPSPGERDRLLDSQNGGYLLPVVDQMPTGPFRVRYEPRLFRREGVRFQGRAYEQLLAPYPMSRLPEGLVLHLQHPGYGEPERARRLIPLLEKSREEATSQDRKAYFAYALGEEYLRLGEAHRAAQLLSSAWNDSVGTPSPIGIRLVVALMRALLTTGQGHAAVPLAEEMALKEPDFLEIHYYRALALRAAGRPDRARESLLQALSLPRQRTFRGIEDLTVPLHLWRELGEVNRELGRKTAAAYALGEALRGVPQWLPPKEGQLRLLLEDDAREEARLLVRNALLEDPQGAAPLQKILEEAGVSLPSTEPPREGRGS